MNTVRVPIILLALSTVAFGQNDSHDWPGWRGVERHGVHPSATPPVEWSVEQNVDWVVDLPGEGHSSPVISQGRVFVTAAYPVPHRDSLKQLLIALTFGSIGLAAMLGFGIAGSANALLHEPGGSTLAPPSAQVAFLAAILGFVTLGVLGPPLLDFDRCVIRSWLGTNLTAALGLILAATAVRGTLLPTAMVLALVGLGVVTIVALPAKEHAFRSGYGSASALVVIAVAAAPVLLGLLRARAYRLGISNKNELAECGAPIARSFSRLPSVAWPLSQGAIGRSPFEDFATSSHNQDWARGKLADRAIWYALLAGGWCFAYWIGSESGPDSESGTQHSGDKLIAVISLALAVPIGAWMMLTLVRLEWVRRIAFAQKGQCETHSSQLSLFLSAIVVVGVLVGLILAAIWHSGYLRYQLGSPKGDLVLPKWPYSVLTFAFVILGGIGSLVSYRASTCRSSRFSAIALWVAAVASSAFLFVDRNLMTPRSVLTRAVLCYDLNSGQPLWAVECLEGPEGQLHRQNSPATPTTVVSGDRLYAYFGSTGLVCTTIDGRLLWTNPEIRFQSIYGVGVSPIVHNGLVIVVNGMPDVPHVVACDSETGDIVCRTELAPNLLRHSGHSRTPIVCRRGEMDVLIVWGFEGIDGLNAATGDRLWNMPLRVGGDLVASIVSDGEKLFFVGDGCTTVIAIDDLLGCRNKQSWSKRLRGSNCSSPVVYDGLLFMVSDNGIVSCVDAATGQIHWRERLQGGYYASPVAANGHVYFMNIHGLTTVIAADTTFRIVASNDLGEPIFASPAPLCNSLIVRTVDRLYKLTRPRAVDDGG
jgi:outer membrane protein assembly factor BamB